MKLERRLQRTLDILKEGPATAPEITSCGISGAADAICKLRAHGFRIVTILGDDGRAIYTLMGGENE